jgi:hypothetical protein
MKFKFKLAGHNIHCQTTVPISWKSFPQFGMLFYAHGHMHSVTVTDITVNNSKNTKQALGNTGPVQ